MNQFLQWLDQRKAINWILLVLMTIMFITFHDQAQKPFFWFVEEFSYEALQLVLNILFGALALFLLWFLIQNIWRHQQRLQVTIFGLILFLLSLFSYMYLMPYKSEGVHFVQYAILGLVCYPLFNHILQSLSIAMLAGMIDEHWQYLVSQKLYLDFNDMILNCLAAILGVFIGHIFMQKTSYDHPSQSFLLRPYTWIIIWGLLLSIMIVTGLVSYFDDQNSAWNWYLYRHDTKTYDPAFWYTVPWGKWHQFRPISGILLIVSLPLLSLFLRSKKNKHIL